MNFCHFVTKHFNTLCKVELGEDTIIILFTNTNDTFFYLKMTFFQAKCPKYHFTFCQRAKMVGEQTGTASHVLLNIKIYCNSTKSSIYFHNFVTIAFLTVKQSFKLLQEHVR